MSESILRIGTRESQLAVWQAQKVKALLLQHGYESELVYIKSEGDINLTTPLYEIGVQGIFTRSLDIALLENRIDLAVHSMKDVPTRLPQGIVQAAVLERGNYKDLLVFNDNPSLAAEVKQLKDILATGFKLQAASNDPFTIDPRLIRAPFTLATSSIRRQAQWLYHFPTSLIENLRGNVNTRMKKLAESNWHGAIFAAAGLERIGLRPADAIELDWMLPAPAQGAIVAVCREKDTAVAEVCRFFNDPVTELCTQVEKDFLRRLLGGCSTPISALATVTEDTVSFQGSILSVDGKEKAVIEKTSSIAAAGDLGAIAAAELLQNGGQKIAEKIRHAAGA